MFYQLEHIGAAGSLKREEGENFSYPTHLHQCFELILLKEGEMTVDVDGAVYRMEKGSALFIFPNQIHSMTSHQSRHTLFIFSQDTVRAFYSDKAGTVPVSGLFFPSEVCLALLDTLSEKSTLLERKGALYTVSAEFDRGAEYTAAAPDRENILSRVLSYVEEHFKEPLTVEDVARSIHYNGEYLARLFQRKMGLSFHRYVNMRRLNHAAYLLANTDATCVACAMESGFASLRSFNRNFKKEFGITPVEYKARK